MEKSKIIDKIQKCLRLSQSGNVNESALALKHAQALMRKYDIAESEVKDPSVTESTASSAGYYNPPYWAIALSELVAEAFECRAYVSRCEQGPRFRFMGVGASAEVSAYTFTVLFRQLRYARRQYLHELALADTLERSRRGNVFAQAWLYRIAQTVSDFVRNPDIEVAIDAYVQEHYGEPLASERLPATIDTKDYEIIMSGMKAANQVLLCRPMSADKEAGAFLEDVNYA